MSYLDETVLVDVSGSGKFPMDMLRHDCAWPADTASAMNILRTDSRTITICVSKLRFFNPDRWASFGWAARKHKHEDQKCIIKDT